MNCSAIFPPEFFNLVDDIVRFKSLTEREIEQVAELMMNDLRCRPGRAAHPDRCQ